MSFEELLDRLSKMKPGDTLWIKGDLLKTMMEVRGRNYGVLGSALYSADVEMSNLGEIVHFYRRER